MYKLEYKGHGTNQKKMKFGQDEDKKLTRLVSLYGEDWNQIIQYLPGRSVRQVMERWKYYLDPSINNDPWTPEEDKRLLEYQLEFGNKWTKMLGFFKNRTANQLKNRWLGLERKSRSKGQTKQTKSYKNNNYSNSPILDSPPNQEIKKPVRSLPSINSFGVPNSTPIEFPLELFKPKSYTDNIPLVVQQTEVQPLRKQLPKIPSIADFLN